MARLHGRRTDTPAWQALSVALAANDLAAVSTILASDEPLSTTDRLVALRAVGDDGAAHALAANAMRTAPTPATRDFAAGQYAELRAARPSWAEGFARRSTLGALDTVETGVGGRHTTASGLGLSFELARRALEADALDLQGRDARTEAAFALAVGEARRRVTLALGFESGGDDGEIVRGGLGARLGSADERRELGAELALLERPTESPELEIAAVRDRASLDAESAFGRREYVRLRLDATEHRGRATERVVARGVAAALELGTRGAVGASAWSAGVRAAHERHDRRDALVGELGLRASASADSVLAPRRTTLALGASVVHGGGVGGGFPATEGPRWFVDASVDHDWPARSFGLRVDTGLGLRVLGGDELSLRLAHDTRAATATGADGTELGVGYRFHF